MRRTAVRALLGLLAAVITLGAQSKPPATFADYGQWETLAPAGSRGGFSPDGRWLAYAINRSNRDNELRVTRLDDGTTKVAAFGAQPVYSSDARWLAYSIGQSEADQEKLRSEKKPVQNKLGLLNLATGEMSTIDAIESFAFSADGAWLVLRPYGADRPPAASDPTGGGGRGGGRDASDSPEDAPGTTLIVRHLASGRDMTFGNISRFAWQDAGQSHLLAMIISAAGKTGNGVHMYDPATGVLRVLESSSSTYTDLAWRKDSSDLAVLRARTDDRHEGSTYVVLAWSDLGKTERLRTYDPAADATFPAGTRTAAFRRLSWSEAGNVLFLGTARWEEKIEPPAPSATAAQGSRGAAAASDAEASTVEVWHWKDVFVRPRQKTSANADRRRTLLAAWHLDSGKLVPLATDPVSEQVTPIRRAPLAFVAEWSKYAMNRTIGRPAADLYVADITTGARTKLRDAINDRFVQSDPAGKHLLFLQDDHYWTVNLATRAITNITKTAATSFIDRESDQTAPQKPPFGVAGWTRDGGSVLLYDKFDIWQVAVDGSKARRLTSGAAEQVRHRLVRLDPDEEWVDLSKPVYVSVFGERTKKSGYAQLKPAGGVDRLLWLDRGVGSLAKAKDADVYGYVAQDYDDSPDIFVAGAELTNAKQATATNPFQSRYAWGRSELVEYKTQTGRSLQGALYYPAGYAAGRQYPMIVYMYELLSQNVHRYVAPSDRDYYNTSVFTSQGYFVFQPDIVFTKRQPGVSVAECVTAGVRKVLEMGAVDPKRVGAIGHSMGGFDAAFLATHTTGVFAAAVAGAPITDLVSYYGDHHWSSGIAETDHIETGQERMEVALYEDFPAYVANSAVFNVQNMSVPLLLEAGDVDGTVAWHQSIELYNIARRAKKNVVLIAYIGEDHGLRQKKNQMDYERRILAWFGHYLKGEPAEPWITDGQSLLDREAEVKRLALKK
ncbi:MAG: prolyl oligopeptidase family serine peptidase [Acidobacteria bacterium]|nr:prolyl oligopeptidase family serine peptidase [Acidobacteriota bacterium]